MSAPAGARVVVVDDALFMRRLLRDLLEDAGHRVVGEGDDGDQLVELYETHRPDLVTLDLVMPNVGGLEALEALLTAHPDATVIVCSSVSDERSILEAIGLGARDYVLKPVQPAKLLDAVAKALRARG